MRGEVVRLATALYGPWIAASLPPGSSPGVAMTAPPRSLHDPWIAAADKASTSIQSAASSRQFLFRRLDTQVVGSMSLGSAGATRANLAKPNSIAATPR
jgi:hypothetical protein